MDILLASYAANVQLPESIYLIKTSSTPVYLVVSIRRNLPIMNKTTPWIVGVVVVALIALGAWWYMGKDSGTAVTPEGTVAGETERFPDGSKDGAAEEVTSVTIGYTSAGFSPKTVTVQKGTKVTFVNQGTGEMWVASDEHPSHTQYSGTSRENHCPDPGGVAFDQCAVGTTFSFVFAKTGSFEYHNHRESDHKGTIVVTE
jgi:plastocyanin